MYKAKKNKLSNRTRILECIYRNAPVARTEIAEMTEITPATVTANVTALINSGIVVELGEAEGDESVTGRKRVQLDLNPSYACSIGVEFTQKALIICKVHLKGTVLEKKVYPFHADLAREITDRIISGVNEMVASHEGGWNRILGVGIAVPGHMDVGQTAFVTNRKIWSAFDPVKIGEAFPVSVVYENNARCMALKQYLFSPATCPDSFAFFHVGLGMFCANIVDGELFLGNNYVAGEIGHTIVKEGGRRCECGKYGCLQTYASENWLLKNSRLLYENDSRTYLRSLVKNREDLTISRVTAAYSMGDEVVSSFITEALKYLGVTTSNIAIIMNPGKIFLHGELFDNGDICTELKDYIDRQLLFVDSSYIDNVEILPYSLEDGAIGGAALAVQQLFIKEG